MSDGVLLAIERAAEVAADADDVLRETVRLLAAEPGVSWAGIAFVDRGDVVPGPAAGEPAEGDRRTTPILWEGAKVGELLVDGDSDRALLDAIASAIAAHVLIGWDTGGQTWDP